MRRFAFGGVLLVTAACSSRASSSSPASPAPSADELRRVQLEEELDGTPMAEGQRRLEALDKPALLALARDGGCAWAVRAAFVLEQQGDPSYLPRRGTANDPATLARRLCLIANIPSQDARGKEIPTRKLELLRDFLPPNGEVTTSERGCSDEESSAGRFSRADADGDELDVRFGGAQLDDCVAAQPEGSVSCAGVSLNGGTATIVLSPDKDGRLYLRDISFASLVGCH